MKLKLSSLKLQNNKGMTLIELLAVVVILGILIIASLSYINNSFDKARQSDVQHVFENFRDNSTVTLQDAAGQAVTIDDLDKALDKALYITPDATTPTKGATASKKDPWGHAYVVNIYTIPTAINANTPAQTQIVVSSNGKDGVPATADDFNQAIYYSEGNTDSGTHGFNKNDIKPGVFTLGTDATCIVTAATPTCSAPVVGTSGIVGVNLIAK